jgi:undecaprenyl-diphosphatase
MTWWDGVVLGLIQGLTEFLPVSSSGHLVVAEQVLGVPRHGVVVEVTLHVATLVAVLVVYRARVWELLRGMSRRQGGAWRYVGLLVVATIPAGVIGALFDQWFEQAFGSLSMVGVDFLLTGFILWSTRRAAARAVATEPSFKGATAIGFAQAFSILPGISRSGSTIAASLWVGLEPAEAAEFSFLMSVPVIAGAALLKLPALPYARATVGTVPLALGFVTALVCGVIAIKLLVRLLVRGAFHRFAPYCWAMGVVALLLAVAWT